MEVAEGSGALVGVMGVVEELEGMEAAMEATVGWAGKEGVPAAWVATVGMEVAMAV